MAVKHVEVSVAQQDGEIQIYDPYAPIRGGEERVTYKVSDHTAKVHPDHAAIVESAAGGERYKTDTEAAKAATGPLSRAVAEAEAAGPGGTS